MNVVLNTNCVGAVTYLSVGGGGSDSYPVISQPTDVGRRVKQQPTSHLLLVNVHFLSPISD